MEQIVEIDGKNYTLHMTRSSIRKLESVGLDPSDMIKHPALQLTYLTMCALLGGGATLPMDKLMNLADKYLDSVEDTAETMDLLSEMYSDVFPTRE